MRGQGCIKFVIPFLLAVMGGIPCVYGETLNRVVAIVNNQVITLHELNKKMKEVTGYTPDEIRSRNEQVFLDTREKILELMIDEKITDEKIRELKIEVGQKQVDDAVEMIKKENGWTQEDLLAVLKKEGMTYERYVAKIKKDLERMRLINSEVKSKIIITEERIKRYYEEHKDKFAGETKVHLAGIFLVRKEPQREEEIQELTRKGEELLRKLKAGEDFAALARQFSDGPGADEGGDLGTFSTKQLEPDLRKTVQSLPVGGFSGLIVRPNGIQIIKVLSSEGGDGRSLEEVKDAIYSALYQEEVNRRYVEWIRQLREKSYTKIIF